VTVSYRVLVVCTGNICRSPFTAQLFAESIGRIGDAVGDASARETVEVISAGTHALAGRPIEPAMAVFLRAYGAEAREHAARQLEADLVRDADLVLALTRDHRRDIVRMLPAASRRVFALGEFTRLLEDARAAGVLELAGVGAGAGAGAAVGTLETAGAEPGAGAATAAAILREAAEAAAMRRGWAIAPDDPAADDVVDPYGRDDAVYRAAAEQMVEHVGRIEAAILGALREAR